MSRRRSSRGNAGRRSTSCVSFGVEHQQPYLSSNIGTIHTFNAISGIEPMNRKVYEKKSMEELRFEDYMSGRKCPSLHTNSLFSISTTNQNIFNPNNVATSSTLGPWLFENKPVVSKPASSLFSFGAPITQTAPFTFSSTPNALFGSSIFTIAPSIGSRRPFIFGSRQTATIPTEMKDCTGDNNEDKTERKCLRPPSPEITRVCVDCKKVPQMQCLHCSQQVCLDCAKEHVALVTKQVDKVQHDLNDKTSILDRLAAAAKERVNLECDKIKQGLDAERDRAFVQIDQLLEQQKKHIQDKSNELNQLSLDKISSYIQRITTETENLNEDNDQLFCVTSTVPKIQVQQKR